MSTKLKVVRGPSLIALVSIVILAGVMLTLRSIPDPELAWRSAVRLTARTSAILFLVAFSASAATTHWPGSFTRWMCANRRYIGLSFAASHTIHAYTIFSLASLSETLSHQILQYDKIIAPGLGYLFIFALAVTSSNWAQATLGRERWTKLHLTGTHYLWLLFLLGFLKHAPEHPEDWLGVAFMLVAMGMRIAARRQLMLNGKSRQAGRQ